MMTQALDISITKNSLGVLAVMIVMAAVFGAVVWLVTGFFAFTGFDSGSRFTSLMATLSFPLIVLAVLAGGFVGFLIMH